MVKYNPKYPLISLHIMKTGGTSLGLILRDWFGDGYYEHYADHERLIIQKAVRERNWLGCRRHGLCVHGHFINGTNNALDIYPKARQFVALLRDPLAQHLSSFHFQKKTIEQDGQIFFRKQRFIHPVYLNYETDALGQTDDPEEFIAKGRCTILRYMPFEFTLDNYRDIFETYFVHIGCNEQFVETVTALAHKLNRPVPKPWPHEHKGEYEDDIGPELADGFYKRHPLETELYRYSRSLSG